MNNTFRFGVPFRIQDMNPSCMYLINPIQGYIVPILAVLVSCVNLLAVAVFMQPRVRSHTTLILTLIACTDTLNILCPASANVWYYSLGNYKEYVSYKCCFLTYLFGDVSVEFFNGVSLWLTVLLAYIRCRCLKAPFDVHNIHTTRRIVAYVVFIIMFTVTYHLPSLFLYDFSPVTVDGLTPNTTKEACVIAESNFIFKNSSIGRKVQFCAEVVLDSIVPCVILVYLDFVILLTLRKAKMCRFSLRSRDQSTHREMVQNEIPCDLKMEPESFRKDMKNDCRSIETHANENCGQKIETLENTKTKSDSRSKEKRAVGILYKVRCLRRKQKFVRNMNSESVDHAFDRLDRECRRTSWLILAIATIVTLHEIPLAVANVYVLVKHAGVSLPLNVYGCLSVFLLLWQYVTYLVIFLMYAFMSSAFRTELTRLLTSLCRHKSAMHTQPQKMFLSPCAVRKTLSRDQDATVDENNDIDMQLND